MERKKLTNGFELYVSLAWSEADLQPNFAIHRRAEEKSRPRQFPFDYARREKKAPDWGSPFSAYHHKAERCLPELY
jgi:hypothetical protein